MAFLLAFAATGARADIYRVTAGADGTGDGTEWAKPMTLAQAMTVVAAGGEIWLKGETFTLSAAVSLTATGEVTIRGGFDGEASADLRASGAASVIDGANANDILTLANSVAVTFERVRFYRGKNRAIKKTGAGALTVRDCAFQNNGRSVKASGRAINATGTAATVLTVTNTVFEGNMYANERGCGWGGAVYLSTFDHAFFDDCLFVTNGVFFNVSTIHGTSDNGGSAIYATACPVTARRCRFAGNCTEVKSTSDGGCVRLEGASGGSAFTNCVWIGNTEWLSYTPGTTYASGALSINLSTAAQTVDVKNCTFAYNLTCGSHSPGGLNVRGGTAHVTDSIIWGNIRGRSYANGGGCDISVQSSGKLKIERSVVASMATDCFSVTAENGLDLDEATVLTADPHFVTTTNNVEACIMTSNGIRTFSNSAATYAKVCAFDAHVLSAAGYVLNSGATGPATATMSPAIDLGAVGDDCSAEPYYNGGRLNAGAYGNTTEASKTPTGQPKVASIDITCTNGFSRPFVSMTMGIDSGDNYIATVRLICATGGVTVAEKTFISVHDGDTVEYYVPAYFDSGTVYTISYTVTAANAITLSDSIPETATGTKPDHFGKGGGAHVVHVRSDADCFQTGDNWTDAVMDIASALAIVAADATKTEIWISSGTYDTLATVTLASPLAVRGGFAGTENVASERTAGTITRLDNLDTKNGLTIENGADCPLEFERIAFCRMSTRALKKTGTGDLTVRDCKFLGNGRSASAASGRGIYAVGSATTVLTVTNTVFEGNMYMTERNMGYGGALYIETFARAFFDDCQFVTNGIFYNSSKTWGNATGRGSALYATACPVTMRRCRFAGNCVDVKETPDGGCVYLTGASGGSAFTNCVWTGNTEWLSQTPGLSATAGALVVNLSSSDGTVDLKNCTIAYNLTVGSHSPGGINVNKGTVNVADSIVYGNIRGYDYTGGAGRDIAVQSSGKLTFAHSIVTSNELTYVSTVTTDGLDLDEATVYTVDPLFVTPTATVDALKTTSNGIGSFGTAASTYATLVSFDAHLLSTAGYFLNNGAETTAGSTSPAIDKGNPSSDYSFEPAYNGGQVNLGAYGNTVKASKTPVGQPKVISFNVIYADGGTRPTATLAMGSSSGTDYSATVTLVCKNVGVTVAEKTFENVHNGDYVSWNLPYYFDNDDELTFSYTVNAASATEVSDSTTSIVSGTNPDFVGKGGGEHVIHVRAGADCLMNGENWTDAYPDLASAFAAVTNPVKTEIWISTGNFRIRADISITNNLAVRGGFAGSENSASERAAGTVSVIDNEKLQNGLTVENNADAPLEFECLVFCNMTTRALQKTGAGGLTIRDCKFFNNGRSAPSRGRAFDATGSSTAVLTVASTVFDGNMDVVLNDRDVGLGGAVYVSTFARAFFDNCTFTTNGVHLNEAGYYGLSTRSAGSAVYASGAPVTMRRCRFAGNVTPANQSTWGGCVFLENACGGSAFTNCVWVGNAEWNGNSSVAETMGGGLVVNLNSSGATVDIKNCTFAYNLSIGVNCGGLNVVKGTVNLKDSIVYGNICGRTAPSTLRDISVRTGGRLAMNYVAVTATNCIYNATEGNLTMNPETIHEFDPLMVTSYDYASSLTVASAGFTVYAYTTPCYAQLAAMNVHLKGNVGYVDETTGRIVCYRSQDKTTGASNLSPAVDAGDPASEWRQEYGSNGCRVNLGAYGNTPWATQRHARGLYLGIR